MRPQWYNPSASTTQATGEPIGPDQEHPSGQFAPQTSASIPSAPGLTTPGLTTPAQAAIRELAGRAQTLLTRLSEVEDALTDQEWWLMGRAMPEARVLAEMTSLLSVARGELETFIDEATGIPREAESAAHRKEQDDVFGLMDDPMWMSGSREKAIALLRMCAAQIAPMRQYAVVLQTNAERQHLPAVALDPLGITAERLGEAEELLRQPLR